MKTRARLQGARHRTRKSHLKSVENPRDAERQHHGPVESRPAQPVEPRRQISVDDHLGADAGRFIRTALGALPFAHFLFETRMTSRSVGAVRNEAMAVMALTLPAFAGYQISMRCVASA